MVSVYMVKKDTDVHHWHVQLSMLSQKLQLLKTIQDNAGVITYEYAEEVTFSIASSKIGVVKAQMPAMRISVSLYGNRTSQETTDSEGEVIKEPVVISVYFSK